ncbi:hypothetical protein C4573_01965 [Candidatus Woesearchaeota archaeon]|nr:MAG: hypothetical protein C4573_01965 [Candidatus Woesearchaeota archaeon]
MTIPLRPHHIERIIELEQKNPLYLALFSLVVRTLYGKATYADYKSAIKRVKAGEEIAVTREVGALCTHCPYQGPCLNQEYDRVSEMAPWFIRAIGGTVLNAPEEDKKALKRLNVDEAKTYTLQDLIHR